MHAEKIATLKKVPGLAHAVVAAAAAAGCSTDDVGHAAHGRRTSPEARGALAQLKAEERAALAQLPWPFECGTCHGLVDALVMCPKCKKSACDGCEVSGLCSSCRTEERRASDVAKKAEARERAQAKKAADLKTAAPDE